MTVASADAGAAIRDPGTRSSGRGLSGYRIDKACPGSDPELRSKTSARLRAPLWFHVPPTKARGPG